MPEYEVDQNLYMDQDAALTTCLGITLLCLLLETVLFFRQLILKSMSLLCLILHAIACTLLIKFIVDSHIIKHFWLLFVFFNIPQLLFQIYILLSSFNKQNFF